MKTPKPTNQTQHLKRKVRTFILMLLIICSGIIRAQPYNTMNVNYNYIYNTGVAVSCPSLTPGAPASFTPIAPGGTDPNWMVNTTCAPGGPYARVMSTQQVTATCPGLGISQNNALNFPYNSWITMPTATCTAAGSGSVPGSGSYSCVPGGTVQDVYFNRAVNVPTNNPTPYMLRMSINASDFVQAVWIRNGAGSTYTVWNSNSTSSVAPHAWDRNTAIEVSTCSLSAGTNYVIVHVKTMNPQSNPCKFIGMRATCWNLPAYSIISGTNSICPGSTSLYTVPNATAQGYFPPISTTFTWTNINSWSGSSTSATLSATAGTNSGVLINSLLKNTPNGKYCLSTGGYSVNVPPPITTMFNPTMACAGQTVGMLALGATNYTWYNVFGNAIATNTPAFITGPLSIPGASFIVKGISTGGCVLTKTIGITVNMTPTVVLNTGTTSLCQGTGSVGLWASGNAVSYTWSPVSPPTNSLAPSILVQPNATTVFTLTGKSAAGCTATVSKTITIYPTPTLAVANPSAICSGTTTTLTAQGGTSYTLTSPFTVNTTGSFVVSPMVTTVYTIIATNSFNCSKTMTINVIVNPSPNFTVSPTSVCLGLSNTLTASGAINYTWTVWPTANPANKTVTPNSSSVVITPTASMTFSLCSSTNSNNCVRCTTSVINMGVPVPMSVSDMTMCTSASNCTNISVSTATTTNCTWQPTANISGSPNGATVNVCPVTFPATYTVFATSTATNTCPNQAVMSVYQETNCCSQPTTGLTVLSGIQGIYFNGNYLLNTSQSLLGDTYLRSSEVWITPGVQLTVPSGSLLSLEHVHMFACSDRMWKGIKLMDAAILTTPQASTATHQNSLIEDAEIAVDVDYSTMNMSNPTPTISIEGTIFNKNHIGIRMANMPPGTSLNGGLDLNVNGCIFSSRNMPFTTYPTPGLSLSWPSSALVSPGLKVASNSTAGLNPPYIFPGMAQAFTKQPYNTQPGYIGIELKKLNDSLAAASGSTNGVVIMNILQGASIAGDFVLFDGLSYGIDIYEAGLVSKNLVFQNTQTVSVAPSFTPEGGDGVRHRMTSLVNTNFDLYPSQGNGTFGMRCWDCVRGLNIENVYHVSVPNSIFRSTQWAVNATAPNMQGAYGIYAMTNRFNYNFSWNEFNNVRKGISINTPAITQNYDMGGNGLNPVPGIFADYLNIGANYFGPEVNSSTGYSSGSANVTEFMETAVEIITPNTNGWANSIQSSGLPNGYIYFNKLDRVFRGITINGTEDFPLSVEQNSVYVEDDFTFGLAPGNPAPGWGISLSNSTNAKTISTNTLESMGNAMATNSVSLVHCYYNFGNQSPNVHCNFTKNAHYGFQFEDRNDSTVWGGNHMCNEYAGLALVNNGVIGQQGNSGLGSENYWEAGTPTPLCMPWQLAPGSNARYQTYADNSIVSLSPLYVFQAPGFAPNINGSNPPNTGYNGSTILAAAAHNTLLLDCSLTNSIMPNWRMNNSVTNLINQSEKSTDEEWVNIYPNPTNGDLTISCKDEAGSCDVKIYDLQGRIVYQEQVKAGLENNCQINNLPASIYLIEVKKENKTIRKKLIKTN